MSPTLWLSMAWFVGAVAIAVRLQPPRTMRRLPGFETRPPRGSVPVAMAGLVSLLARPLVLVKQGRARRVAATERELADVIDLFALAVGSGLNLRLALVAVASRAPPSWVGPLGAAVARVDRGIGVADALDELPAATGEFAHPLVSVLVSSERYGTILLPALERLAIEARFDRRRRAEESARRVPVKLLFPLVLCILPAFGALTVAPLLAGAVGSLGLS